MMSGLLSIVLVSWVMFKSLTHLPHVAKATTSQKSKFINLKPKSYSLTAYKYSSNTENFFLTFYFKITVDSEAVVRNNTEWTCVLLIRFPSRDNYSTVL